MFLYQSVAGETLYNIGIQCGTTR